MNKVSYLCEMKKYLLFILLCLTSCEKFVLNNSDITLSGRYVVSQVDIIYTDRPSVTFIGGQTYVNPKLPHPFNNIKVNDFYMLFEGGGFTGWFKLGRIQPYSSNLWSYGNNRELFFDVYGNNSYNHGYLSLKYIPINTNTYQNMIFRIEEDGLEHLKLLNTGVYDNQGNKTQIRLYLHREHP